MLKIRGIKPQNLVFQVGYPSPSFLPSQTYPKYTFLVFSPGWKSPPPPSLPAETTLGPGFPWLQASGRTISHNSNSLPALWDLDPARAKDVGVLRNYKWVDVIDEWTGIVQPPVRAEETAD